MNSEIEKMLLSINSKLDEISSELKNIRKQVPKKIVWNNKIEQEYIRKNWYGGAAKIDDFEIKYLRLIKDLDAQSIDVVNRILNRQSRFLNSDNSIDFFTTEEQKELKEVQDNLNSQIIQISDDIWAWRNYLLPIKNFESSVFYTKHGIGELRNPNSVKGKVIIDVGGYIGDSVLVLNDELKPSQIHTFEALPSHFEYLKKTLELNNITNCIPVNMALGSSTGNIDISVSGLSSSVLNTQTSQEVINVPMTTLDEYALKNKLEIGLIKVDIEGAEPYFLEGAKQTICKQKPIILLSIYHNSHDFFELKPLIESWNLGYKFKIYHPTQRSITEETLLICEA